MKRFFCFIICFSLISGIFYAADRFSLTVSSGIINGKTSEYVFDKSRIASNYHLSELYYDASIIPCLELSVKYMPTQLIFVKLDGLVGYPKNSGNLSVYRYFNGYVDSDGYHFKGDDPAEYTYYGSHSAKVTNYVNVALSSGVKFYCPYEFRFEPYIKYEFDNIAYEGNDGFEQNKRNNFKRKNLTGRICTYNTISNIANIGINMDVQYLHPLLFSAGCEISPFLTFIKTYDTHCYEEKAFSDTINFAFQVKASFDIMYKFAGNQKIGLKAAVLYQPETYDTTDKSKDSTGGVEQFFTKFTLFYNISFR